MGYRKKTKYITKAKKISNVVEKFKEDLLRKFGVEAEIIYTLDKDVGDILEPISISDLKMIANKVLKENYPNLNIKIDSKSKKHVTVVFRQICYKLAYDWDTYTLSKIGSHFNRHHATVLHGVHYVNNLIEIDDLLAVTTYNRIKAEIKKQYGGKIPVQNNNQ